MPEDFVQRAKAQMGAIEQLLKGLPGISGYIDKELRRDADKRVREGIAALLEQSKGALTAVQGQLLKGGGLALMDEVDEVAVKLQTLIDRVKTASYGYAGFFDPVRIKEEQLNALHRFDMALAQQVGNIGQAIAALAQAVEQKADINAAVAQVGKVVSDMSSLFDKRREAIMSPDLLDEPGYAPDIHNDPDAVG